MALWMWRCERWQMFVICSSPQQHLSNTLNSMFAHSKLLRQLKSCIKWLVRRATRSGDSRIQWCCRMGCKEIVCKYLPELGRSTERSKKNLCDSLSNCKYAREFFKKKADRASTVGFKDGEQGRERGMKNALCVLLFLPVFFFLKNVKSEKGGENNVDPYTSIQKSDIQQFRLWTMPGINKIRWNRRKKENFLYERI